jgi:hypothetical protein
VRLNPTSKTSYSGVSIAHTSGTATEKDVALSGSSVSVITVTSALTAFTSIIGEPSTEESYTVSAINLTGNLAISAPANFELSTVSGGTFTSSLSIAPVNGVVADTLVYVRLNTETAGTYSGNISHTADGATTVDTAISGTAYTPEITTTAALTFFTGSAGVASSVQSYTVAGSHLKGNIP